MLFFGFVGEYLVDGELETHAALVDSMPINVCFD